MWRGGFMMFYAASAINSGVSSSLINSIRLHDVCRGLPGCKSLFFASPKKSKQKKGDPQSGSLRFASGTLRCSKSAEFLETSRLCRRRPSKNFDPLPPALLSPARTGGASGKFGESPLPKGEGVESESESQPVLAGLEKVEGAGLKNLDVRRPRCGQVSKFSGSFNFFKEPRSGPDCGSPFFSLGFFGEAKKSKSPAGASPGMLARGETFYSNEI